MLDQAILVVDASDWFAYIDIFIFRNKLIQENVLVIWVV